MIDPYTQEEIKEKDRFPRFISQGSVILATFDINGVEAEEIFILVHTNNTEYKLITASTGNRWGESLYAYEGNAEVVSYKDVINFFMNTKSSAVFVKLEVLGTLSEIDFYYELMG